MSDSEYEEESVVAVVELKGIMNSDILFKEKPAKILAPESENPVLQFGSYIFRGEWQETMGTVVCFEKPTDEKDGKDTNFKYVAKADKKLSLQRIFLEEKQKNGSSEKQLNGEIAGCSNGYSHMHSPTSMQNGGTSSSADDLENKNDLRKCLDDIITSVENTYSNDCISLPEKRMRTTDHDTSKSVSTAQKRIATSFNNINTSTEVINLNQNKNNSVIMSTSNASSVIIADTSNSKHSKKSKPSQSGGINNEPEDKSIGSSEADFIILNECSNETSCDAEVPPEVKEQVDSSDEVCPSLPKLESHLNHHVGSSKNDVATNDDDLTGIVDSLLEEVQSMHHERASLSPVMQDDVADSASSVEEGKTLQRHSDSFWPSVCDSASGEGTSQQVIDTDYIDITGVDCSSQISTSGGRISSSKPYSDVFEDEAMDTTENTTNESHLSCGVGSIDTMEIIVLGEEQGSSEISDSSVANPQYYAQKSSQVNSTCTGTSSVNQDGNACISHDSGTVLQNYDQRKETGLIDSTSNTKTSVIIERTLKEVPGIDSTTNDSGKKQPTKEGESSHNSSSLVLNERIDSTMNRIITPTEDVDFEMREATNVTEIEEDVSSDSCAEDIQPIDSTSNIFQQTFHRTSRVSESDGVLHNSPRQSYIEGSATYSPCNVTESHIDDTKPLSSFVVSSPGNCSSENLQSEVTESSERSSENFQDYTESDLYESRNCDIAESSLQDDSYGASSSQVTGSLSHNVVHVDLENEDSINKVTESSDLSNYTSVIQLGSYEVTDSTNVSYASSHPGSNNSSPSVIIGDSSMCEVTESSSVGGEGILVIDDSSLDVLDARTNEAEHGGESPSSIAGPSASDVTESRRFEGEFSFSAENNSSSGDGKEPSSSGLNTSEIHVSEACSSAGVISSAGNNVYYYSSAGAQDLSTNEASMSSASGYWASPLNMVVQASDYEVSNSEQNADSTEGESQPEPNRNTDNSSTMDNSKLPSSTSN